jgi:guanylate kinase
MTTVFIISAPSGSGKSTLTRHLFERVDRLLFSVSYTSRAPRGSEVDGVNYNFTSRKDFEEMIGRDEFLEWAKVYDNYYGTHSCYLDRARVEGKDLVLDIDVQGARQLRGKIPGAVTVFILPPSRAILEQRLRARGEDPDHVIERRLQEAAEEIRGCEEYDFVLVNDDAERAGEALCDIVRAERSRLFRMEPGIQPILETFGV